MKKVRKFYQSTHSTHAAKAEFECKLNKKIIVKMKQTRNKAA